MDSIVDLTLTYNNSSNGFNGKTSRTNSADGLNASTLSFYSHCGANMDAPIQFNVSAKTIDKIPL